MQQLDVYYQLLSQHAHLWENKDCVTARGVLLWFCWMWLVAVNKMQQLDVYYQLLSQDVSGTIMPIFRRTNTMLLHVVYCSGSAGCGW